MSSRVRRNPLFVTVIFFSILLLLSCPAKTTDSRQKNDGKTVYVSIPPLAFITGQIAGNVFEVKSLLGELDNPHTWVISPRKLQDLQDAFLLVQIGGGFENYITDTVRKNLESLRTLDLSGSLDLHPMEAHGHNNGDHAEHDSAGHHGHNHGANDPHFWLGPDKIEKAAEIICAELVRLKPEDRKSFEKNLSQFRKQCAQQCVSCRELLAKQDTKAFFVFHPSFGYFAEYFGLEQCAVETNGKSPSPQQLRDVIEKAREFGIKTIISQPQFSKTAARAVARAIDGRVTVINHLQKNIFVTLTEICEALSQEDTHAQ
ncbi:MAG: zinc ABC transporter substrate-binding protein [Spirochaetales bacterium]|nr:zinc ABC transporter substrate-binding protein [Spirochaetales bacterium]